MWNPRDNPTDRFVLLVQTGAIVRDLQQPSSRCLMVVDRALDVRLDELQRAESPAQAALDFTRWQYAKPRFDDTNPYCEWARPTWLSPDRCEAIGR